MGSKKSLLAFAYLQPRYHDFFCQILWNQCENSSFGACLNLQSLLFQNQLFHFFVQIFKYFILILVLRAFVVLFYFLFVNRLLAKVYCLSRAFDCGLEQTAYYSYLFILFSKFYLTFFSTQQDLLQDFDSQIANWSTLPKRAYVIVKKGPFLKLYTMYIREFSAVNYHFDECCAKYPKFAKKDLKIWDSTHQSCS